MFLLFSNLDKIVETGIETAGSSALGSRVEVGSVAIDLTSGAASIYNFSVANPTGYSNAEMISFDELSVAIDLQNTNSQNVHVTSILARSPHVLSETSAVLPIWTRSASALMMVARQRNPRALTLRISIS